MNPKYVQLIVGLVCLVALSVNSASLEGDSPVDVSLDETTVAPKNTYFGVDADDAEAVARKQKELGDEKAKQLFGDVDLDEHLNFDIPDFNTKDHPLVQKFNENLIKLREAFRKLASLFPSTTTASPSA